MNKPQAVQLGSIELFCKAAELGSFSAAAQQLGLTPASVSRAIRRMETRLGVRLFARTTRSVQLTPEGALYWQECRQALTQIAEAERTLSGSQQVPRGTLRISTGSLYGNYRLLPQLTAFSNAYPQLAVELSLSNHVADLVEEGLDLAIRVGSPQVSGLIARPLEHASLGVFATPAYLARYGQAQTPAELAAHRCLLFVQPSSGRPAPWLFHDLHGQAISYTPPGPMLLRDDPQACISWGLAGGGVFQSYHFIVADALARGELVEILQPYAGRSRTFWLLYPQQRQLSARVRAFIDFLLPPPAR